MRTSLNMPGRLNMELKGIYLINWSVFSSSHKSARAKNLNGFEVIKHTP